jgi:hypothetical protein
MMKLKRMISRKGPELVMKRSASCWKLANSSRREWNRGGSESEAVGADQRLPVVDSCNFNSDNKDYDSDDYAKTMALNVMMLRKSKANFPS